VKDGANSISGLLDQMASDFKKRGYLTPRLDAEVLLSSFLKMNRPALFTHGDRKLTDRERTRFRAWVKRRQGGEPVTYITGHKEFWSLDFEVNRHVLIPRPETECLVEEALSICSVMSQNEIRILEIGTGSGAIIIALTREMNRISAVATDISGEAIETAERNAGTCGVASRISFIRGNMFEPVRGEYDMILSNPPYVSDEEFETLSPRVRDYEPAEALRAGPDGTEFHRRLIADAPDYLKTGGWLILEIGALQRDRVEKLLRGSERYRDIRFRRDYAGMDRVVLAKKE
jgi:release factor glutamine methyltransferase